MATAKVSGAETMDTARAAADTATTREPADTGKAAADTGRATSRRKAGPTTKGAGARAGAATAAVGSSEGLLRWATSSRASTTLTTTEAGATEAECRRKCRRNLLVRTCWLRVFGLRALGMCIYYSCFCSSKQHTSGVSSKP